MAPGLQARYPSIRTYTIQSASLSGRFSVTPHGIKGVFFDSVNPIVIEPMGDPAATDVATYAVFRGSDLLLSDEVLESLHDDVVGELAEPSFDRARRVEHGETLRTYRLAVATEGEFTERSGGTVELSLAAVVASVNRANAIYERDMSLTFQLVENNDQIVFTDSESDPFTASGGGLLDETQDEIDATIGDENYDVGHLIRYGSEGGLARLQASCVSGAKAQGWSDIRDSSSLFDLLVFPHELGHMLGGPHSWVQFEDDGDFERNGFEPGPGFTIMSYPQFARFTREGDQFGFFFHGGSIDFLNAHVRDGNGAACGTETETGNDIPVVTVPDAFSIPLGSQFSLDGSATDGSGTDLTYTWEQMDRYRNGQGVVPFFRSLVPSGTASRTFPSLGRIFNDIDDIDEQTPDRPGVYNFQLTVRDNVSGAGAVGEGRVQIEIVDAGEPFEITSLNEAVVFESGAPTTIRWNVAGTDAGPIGVSEVDILLSTDNGDTFETIAEAVPNTGSADIAIPDVETTEGRLMIRPVGARFFVVNPVAFEIGSAPGAGLSSTAIDVTLDPGETDSQVLTISNLGDASSTLDYTVELQNVQLAESGIVEDVDYFVTTSDDAGGPSVGFTDISDQFQLRFSSSVTGEGDPNDNGVFKLTIPFQFPYYGRGYRSINVSTNGLLYFGNETVNDRLNVRIPDERLPNGVIAPLWDDLDLNTGGVYAAILPDDAQGNERFAVQWNEVALAGDDRASITFQVIMSEDGSIEFQYGALDNARLNSVTVGIENEDGTVGVPVAFQEDFLTSNSAIRFRPPVEWIAVDTQRGSLAGGDSRNISVDLDATDLTSGITLSAEIVVRTNDGTSPLTVIPVTLDLSGTVSSEEEPALAAISLIAPNPASSRAVVSVELETPGHVSASVHDALGRQVALLHDGDASGSFDLEVDAAGLAAGVYLVRIVGDGFTTTRQLVVAR
ncbi:reprolysin-like metallopeptidase [Rubrivirga sp.]|uniref:reprolysin-like metallopeptidase n=1 Tax=Rubrivirga sp. TaxID=1885344 RepID=UPI003C76E401